MAPVTETSISGRSALEISSTGLPAAKTPIAEVSELGSTVKSSPDASYSGDDGELSVVLEGGNSPVKTIPSDYVSPGEAKWFVLPSGLDAGKKLFYYDEFVGEGELEATLLFVHGNPESSYTYRQAINAVKSQAGKSYRVIAMDHIGFGLSDQASFEMVDMHHSNNLKQLLEFLDPREVTLVIHDWGGAIGIGSLIDTPERVSNIVLMNTTVFPMPLNGWNFTNFPFPGKLSWNSLGYWMPWRWWRAVPPLVMYSSVGRGRFALRALSVLCRAAVGKLTEREKMHWEMFSTESNARSSQRNVKQTKVWGHGYCYFDRALGWQDNRDFYKNIQKNLSKRWGPKGRDIGVRAFWGEWDPTAQQSVRQQWVDALPQVKESIKLYPNRGHFVEEHEYEDIARAVVEVSGLT
ncbi:MAG: alpha/beta fold hydrolase [Cellvibrionaceae bacterium]